SSANGKSGNLSFCPKSSNFGGCGVRTHLLWMMAQMRLMVETQPIERLEHRLRALLRTRARKPEPKILIASPRLAAPKPVSSAARKAQEVASGVEGMLSSFSMAVLQTTLQFQAENEVGGHIIEFGTYRGRSAAILAGSVREDERLILVDIDA